MPLASMPRSVLCVLVIGLATPLAAQQAPPTCATPEFRQFDFWVGDWNVTAAGKEAGSSSITLEENGCVVHEHWTGSKGGGTGQSFNFYDRTVKQWHQFWVDNSGNYLHLTGTYANDQLNLTGIAPGPNGKPQQQRLIFFKNSDGTVRQLWETSNDAGKTWQVSFDGLYKKKGQ